MSRDIKKYIFCSMIMIFGCNQPEIPEKPDCTVSLMTQISVPIDGDTWAYQAHRLFEERSLRTIDLPLRSHYLKFEDPLDSIVVSSNDDLESIQVMMLWQPVPDQKWFIVKDILDKNSYYSVYDSIYDVAVFAISEERVDSSITVALDVYWGDKLISEDTTLVIDVVDRRDMVVYQIPILQDAVDFSQGFLDPCYENEETFYGYLSNRRFKFGNVWGTDYIYLEKYVVHCFRSPNNFDDFMN